MDPIKQYVDIGIFLAILIGIGWLMHHERMVEKQEIDAAQAVSDLKETQHVAKVNADAAASIGVLQTQLSAALAYHPKPAVTVRMCVQPANKISGLPASLGPSTGGDAPSESDSGVGGIDTAPATEVILARDKALIDYLQGYARTCQTTGGCAK